MPDLKLKVEQILDDLSSEKLSLIRVTRSRITGYKVYLVSDKMVGIYALKYGKPIQQFGKPSINLRQQLQNRKSLLPYFDGKLPDMVKFRIYEDGTEALLMEAPTETNFIDLVNNGGVSDDTLLATHNSIISCYFKMWEASKTTYSPAKCIREVQARVRNILHAIDGVILDHQPISSLGDHLLVVNGVAYCKINEILQAMQDIDLTPTFGIFCHGDPNPDNFLLAQSQIPNGIAPWWLIDYEWVGYANWLLSASHFIGWWHSNASRLTNKPVVCVSGNKIMIDYNIYWTNLVQKIIEQNWSDIEGFADNTGDRAWRKKLRILIALFILGDIRFAEARERSDYIPVLIGEGFSHLYKALKDLY